MIQEGNLTEDQIRKIWLSSAKKVQDLLFEEIAAEKKGTEEVENSS